MKTKLILALLCATLARATTVTFNPATTDTFLDITVDASDGHWIDYGLSTRRWVTTTSFVIPQGNWLIASSFGWDCNGGTFQVVNGPLDRGYEWIWVNLFYYTTPEGFSPILYLGSDGGKIRQGGGWQGAIPQVERLSDLSLRITWEAAAPAQRSVQDGASVLILLIPAAGLMFVRHIRKGH